MEKGFPISPDRAIFLADAHLNQDDIHSRNFLALADRAAAEKVPLFLLGDVFDLWFGNPGLTFAFQKPIVEQLRRLAGRGVCAIVLRRGEPRFLPEAGTRGDDVRRRLGGGDAGGGRGEAAVPVPRGHGEPRRFRLPVLEGDLEEPLRQRSGRPPASLDHPSHGGPDRAEPEAFQPAAQGVVPRAGVPGLFACASSGRESTSSSWGTSTRRG